MDMTEWIRQIMENYGELAIAFLTLIENVFPPIPSEVILPLGGFFVSQDKMTLLGVVIAGTVGSVVGAIILYYVGKLFDQEKLEDWADRHGGWMLLTSGDVKEAFSWFERHGKTAVFLARLVPGVRSLISIPAGAAEMKMAPFLLYSTIGTALWTWLLAFGGLQLGNSYQDLSQIIQWAGYAIIVLLVLSIIWWIIKKKRQDDPTTANS